MTISLTTWPSNLQQPDITANANNQVIQALVQLAVEAVEDDAPTTTSVDVGKAWIVGAGTWPANAVTPAENDVAVAVGADLWLYLTPYEGWNGLNKDTDERIEFDGTDWVAAGGGGGAVDSVNGQTGVVLLALDDLDDVEAATPADGDVLTWDDGAGDWVPAAVPSGFANPMTTEGDIITGGTAGAPQRLGVGADGDVLTLVSGVPDWVTPSGGGAVSSVNGDTGAVIVPVPVGIACSDEATNLTTGTAKATFRMPFAMTLTDVRANLAVAQTAGSIFTVDINEGGTSILSTKLTIDNNEKTSTTAATPPVISDASLADDAEMTVDIDQVGTAGAKGLKIWLIGYPA